MAENLGITIQFQGETLKFDKSISGMNKAINTLKQEVAMLNKELKLDPKNVDLLTKKFNNLKKQEELARDVLAEHVQHLKELNNKGTSPFSDEWKATVKDIRSASDRVIAIKKQINNCQTAIDGCNDSVEEQVSGWDKVADAVDVVGKKAGELSDKLAPVSEAAQNFLGKAANSAIEFQDAFADVQKTVDETSTTSYEDISTGLRDLAKEVPVTADQLAHIAGLAGQMGVKADDIVKFTSSMVQFGDATDITAEEAVKDIAQIYNVIGRGGEFSDLDQLLSTIVELGNNTATTESAIVEMFRNVAAASSRVGMTEPQMAALAATLSSLGLDKGGASAISKIMTNIDKAVDTGGSKLSEWAEVAGMSAKKFKEVWGQDAAAGLLAVVEGIAKSNEEGTSFNQTLEDLGIKEIRQVDTLSRLVNAHENYAENINMANAAYGEGTALSVEAAKRYQTVASKIKILKNNFTEFALSIGDILLPYIDWFIESLHQLTDWLNNLGPHTQQLITRILAIVAVLSPLLAGVAKIMPLLSSVLRFIGSIKTGITFLWTTIQGFSSFLFPMLQALGGFIAANIGWIALIMGVVVAVKTLYENCEPFRELIDNAIQKVKDLWTEFQKTNYIELLGEKFGWFGEILGLIIEAIKTLASWLGKVFSKIGEFLGLTGSMQGAIGGLNNSIGTMRAINVMNSGGFASGGGNVTVNNSWTVNGAEVSRQTVMDWADLITDRVNENLGRMV